MKLISRRRSRECALQILYSWQILKINIIDIASHFIKLQDISDVDIYYFRNLYIGVSSNIVYIDLLIIPCLSRKITDLNYVELIILRIALFELITYKNLSPKIIINEAIELAKNFGTQDSYKFINGVLDSAIRKIYDNNKI